MKRLSKNFLALVGGLTISLTAIAILLPDAWAQVRPRRPIFGADTQVTNLVVDDTATIETLVTSGCTGCGATPGGTTGQVQVNSSGALAGVSEGSSGQVLTSTGVGTAPTFQDASGGSTVYGGYYFNDGAETAILPTGWTGSRLGAGTYQIQTNIADTTNNPWAAITAETPGTCGTIDTIDGSGSGNWNFVVIADDCAGTPGDSGIYFVWLNGTE